MTDDWTQPPPPSEGGKHPALRQMIGRLVVIFPKLIEKDVPDNFNPGKTKDRLTADVVFLEGDPIGHVEHQTLGTIPLDTPVKKGEVMRDVFISNGFLIGQVKGKQKALGVLIRGEAKKGNPPLILGPFSAEQQELAGRWWTKMGQAAFEGAGAPQATATPTAAPAPAPAPAAAPAPAQAPPPAAAPATVAQEEEPF